MGRLPEAWIAPPEVQELREALWHRSKLVALRSGLKAQVHAVLGKHGVHVPMSDLFGTAGGKLLDDLRLDPAYNARIVSLRRLIDALDFEIDIVAQRTAVKPAAHHRESDTTVHCGQITKQGSPLLRWAAVEAVQRLSRGGQLRSHLGRALVDRTRARQSPRMSQICILADKKPLCWPVSAPTIRSYAPMHIDDGRSVINHSDQSWRRLRALEQLSWHWVDPDRGFWSVVRFTDADYVLRAAAPPNLHIG